MAAVYQYLNHTMVICYCNKICSISELKLKYIFKSHVHRMAYIVN